MKYPLSLSICVLAFSCVHAQQAVPRITLHPIGKDSISLAMNDRYNLIADSCATIVRNGHYNFSTHKFFGKFKDVSKEDPSMIRAEGAYTADGLKDGEYISRYSNGNIQSKGTYKNNKYLGKWEVYYKNGKPELNFEADDAGNIKITDMWNNKGIKTIDNGKGAYTVNMGSITWKGDLNDGYPDGSWTAVSRNSASQNILITENFKKGKFQKGNSQAGDYKDASRVVLIDPNILPYNNAEEMIVAPNGCDAPQAKPRVKTARFVNGTAAFNESIKELITPYMGTVNLKSIENEVTFEGVISELGIVGNFKCTTMFDETIARNIINRLIQLPAFEPATLDGKPVPQHITITFVFHLGVYRFSYKLLPVKTDQ